MKKISMFIPCLVDLVLPHIGENTAILLRHLDCEPIYHPEQTCCGLMSFNSGYRDDARRLARHFIRVFENDDLIVSPSGSCVNMVKNRYKNLFDEDPGWRKRAAELAPRVYELSQFIVDHLGVEQLGGSYQAKVAYHESCSTLNALGVSAQPKALIRSVEGAELVELTSADICCGFGGTFANSFPEISTALVRQKTEYFLESGADLLVMCDPGCLLNIRGYLDRHHPDKKAVHIADFLADSLRGEVRATT